jgi:hypothetical protein
MTSGGDSANTDKAKTLLRNAVIGLVIVLSSWAITRYVIENLLNATQDGNGAIQSDDGGGAGGGGFGSGSGSFSSFQLRSITPTGSVSMRNVVVRFVFTRDVDPITAVRAVYVKRARDSNPIFSNFGIESHFMKSAIITFIQEDIKKGKVFDFGSGEGLAMGEETGVLVLAASSCGLIGFVDGLKIVLVGSD